MGATSTISSTVATAEATAQSRLEKKFIKQHSSDHNRVGAAHQRGYDIFAHRRYKYQQGTGDNAGTAKGRVTSTNRRHGRAPKSDAASSKLISNHSKLAYKGNIIKGR